MMSRFYKFKVFNFSEKLEYVFQWAIILTAITFGLFYNYDPVKKFIKEKLFNDPTTSDQAILVSYFSVIIGILLIILFKLGRKMEKLFVTFDDTSTKVDKKLFHGGTNNIYSDVDNEMTERRLQNLKLNIDIIGYTLFSVSPKLEQWKQENKLSNLTLNLYHLDSSFIKESKDIDPAWEHKLKSCLDEINSFKQSNAQFLKRRKVAINLKPYSFIPAVHGFKLGNGSIYMSVAYWNDDFKIGHPNYVSKYIKIEPGDKTQFAHEIRRLFNNWLSKAKNDK